MKRPETRADFERNFHLLHEKMEQGKIHFPVGFSTESLTRVRPLPNGRIDFLSVDEFARLNANTMTQFDDEEFMEAMKAKKESENVAKAAARNDPEPDRRGQ